MEQVVSKSDRALKGYLSNECGVVSWKSPEYKTQTTTNMIKRTMILVAAIFALCNVAATNRVENFDFGWRFNLGECQGAENPSYDDSQWKTVDLPHDWSIAGTISRDNPSFSRGAWLPAGKGAYRKTFTVKSRDAKKRFEILFEGAYRNAEVWINGQRLGMRPFGFIAFFYDMTPHIKAGKNVLTVKLDNSSQPGSRWYTGSGIYRNVKLKVSDKLYIPTWGNHIVANKVSADGSGIIEVNTTVKNDSKRSARFALRHSVYDAEGKVVAELTERDKSVAENAEHVFSSALTVPNAKLWQGVESPYLYTVKSEIMDGKKVVYAESFRTGIRTMEYSPVFGFKLNGKVTKLKGMCVHHDGGPLGAAVYRRTIERQMDILRSMGVNAVRLAHNPFPKEFLEVCDEKGMLVMAESFDEWSSPKSPSYFEQGIPTRTPVDFYAKHFDEWSSRDQRDALLHDRNHPSIFMWSIGNEIHEMKNDKGAPIGKRLAKIVHELDYRPTTNGVNGYGWNAWPSEDAVATSDVRGYNYIGATGFNIERKNAPQAMAIVTECSSVQSFYPRGVFLLGEDREKFFEQLGYKGSTYVKLEESKLFRQEGIDALRTTKEREHVMGQFVWTGFDYLGEVTPFGWPARSSSFSPIDLCGFPKDGYYIYQSQWSATPMVHVYPHWNHAGHEGEMIPLTIFSNCPEVELIVNGKSNGRMSIKQDDVDYKTIYTPYEPGTVELLGYAKKNAKEPIARKVLQTAGEAAQISLTPDRKAMQATSQDLIYITCDIQDKDGIFVPTAANMLEFELSGPAVLIGVGNGDNMSHEPFQANHRKAFSGKALAIIKSTHKSGEIRFTAKSKGLKSQTITVRSEK